MCRCFSTQGWHLCFILHASSRRFIMAPGEGFWGPAIVQWENAVIKLCVCHGHRSRCCWMDCKKLESILATHFSCHAPTYQEPSEWNWGRFSLEKLLPFLTHQKTSPDVELITKLLDLSPKLFFFQLVNLTPQPQNDSQKLRVWNSNQ